MQAFDASSIIYGWDNYPIEVFPSLWRWMGKRFSHGSFCICEIAIDEVAQKSPECRNWLLEQGTQVQKITNSILQEANAIKHLLGVDDDNYHPKGVNENDILIIASSKIRGEELVSNEGLQFSLPKLRAKYRIPAVCSLPDVQVPCMDFITLVKRSGQSFG